MKGIISGTVEWLSHPANSEEDASFWLLGLAFILCLSFLWSTVVRGLVE